MYEINKTAYVLYRKHIYKIMHAQTHLQTQSPTLNHAYTHMHIHAHTRTHTHTHSHTYSYAYIFINIHIY